MGFVAEEFEAYARKVYPKGMIPEQRHQVYQAFMAGIWTLYNELRRMDQRKEPPGKILLFKGLLQVECNEIRDIIVSGGKLS